jgi:Metallo-peptidase family M12
MHFYAARSRLLFASLAGLLATAAHAQHARLLTPVVNVPAVAVAWDLGQRAIDKTIVRSEFVTIDAAALWQQSGPKFQTFRLRMFGKDHVLDFERTQTVLGYRVLFGKVRGRSGDAIFSIAPDGTTHGTIHLVEDSYVVRHSSHADVHVLHELDGSRQRLPHATVTVPPSTAPVTSNGPTTPASGSTLLDVAMFYTPKALAASGNKTAMELRCVDSIAQANATNKSSNLDVEFRLVYVAKTNYTEDGTGNDLSRFRKSGDGLMDEVHKARNTFGADIMHLITQPTKLRYCGVAYLMTSVGSGFANFCFGVTVSSCMNSNVVTHEIGHNLGCHHDRANAGRAAYVHAYGFRTADKKFRTVMAYSPGSRVNIWSSPKVKHRTYVMGTVGSEDNVLTIKKTKATVASFRAQKAVVFCETIGAIAGKFGNVPQIRGQGTPNSSYPPKITISGQWYFSNGLLVIGGSAINIPYFGGILVPSPNVFLALNPSPYPIILDASALKVLPKGAKLWVQVLFNDGAAVQGVSATNGMKIVLP